MVLVSSQTPTHKYHIWERKLGEGLLVFAEVMGKLKQKERFKFCLHPRKIKLKNPRTFVLK